MQVDTCVEGLHEALATLAREYETLQEHGLREGFAPGSSGLDEGMLLVFVCVWHLWINRRQKACVPDSETLRLSDMQASLEQALTPPVIALPTVHTLDTGLQ